jgi:hypothetical protein
MTRDHTVIEELMAVDALSGLDGDDRALLERERESHGADCAECALLEKGFAETAGRLAFALDAERSTTPSWIASCARATDRRRAEAVVSSHRPPRTSWRSAEASARVSGSRRSRQPSSRSRSCPPARSCLRRACRRRRPSASWSSQARPRHARDGLHPGEPGAVFWGADIPDPGADRVYEIWMIEGDEAVSGGCVTPTDGMIAVRVEASIGTTDTMAVTTEPSDCPSTPSSDPILTADLTTMV